MVPNSFSQSGAQPCHLDLVEAERLAADGQYDAVSMAAHGGGADLHLHEGDAKPVRVFLKSSRASSSLSFLIVSASARTNSTPSPWWQIVSSQELLVFEEALLDNHPFPRPSRLHNGTDNANALDDVHEWVGHPEDCGRRAGLANQVTCCLKLSLSCLAKQGSSSTAKAKSTMERAHGISEDLLVDSGHLTSAEDLPNVFAQFSPDVSKLVVHSEIENQRRSRLNGTLVCVLQTKYE